MSAGLSGGTNLAAGALFLIAVQVGSKLCTFGLNQALIRLVSPSILGISSYLEFVISSLLFIGREAARLLIQRTASLSSDSTASLQSIVNFGYIPGLIGIPLAVIVFFWKPATFLASVGGLPYSTHIILASFLSVCLEFACEPIYEINQFNLNFKLRSKLEVTAISLRCIVTFAAVFLARSWRSVSDDASRFEGLAVLAYSLGQLAYSLTVFVGYQLSSYRIPNLSLRLRKVVPQKGEPRFFDVEVLNIWKYLFVQMIFKQLLTQGDILLINYLCSVEEQGVYSVIANYGSMIARLVFQPIEESVRLSFTRLLSKVAAEPAKNSEREVSETLRITKLLAVFYWNLGILLVLGGYFNAGFLLRIMLGSQGIAKWSTTGIFDAFPRYFLYLPFLAFNGIFEALFSSFASSMAIQRFSVYMTFLTCVVLLALYILIEKLHWSVTGLIVSNILNMTLRILYCGFGIIKYYDSHGHRIRIARITIAAIPSLACGLVFAMIQHKYVLAGDYTETYREFFGSIGVCTGCLLTLLFLQRQTILDVVKKPKVD